MFLSYNNFINITCLNIGEKHVNTCPTVYYHTNTFYNILINLLKQAFNRTTLRIEHDNAEHKGTVESHNIVVNKTRILLFYCIIFITELTNVVLHGYFCLLYH